jgi:hypothetical protein
VVKHPVRERLIKVCPRCRPEINKRRPRVGERHKWPSLLGAERLLLDHLDGLRLEASETFVERIKDLGGDNYFIVEPWPREVPNDVGAAQPRDL